MDLDVIDMGIHAPAMRVGFLIADDGEILVLRSEDAFREDLN